MQKTGQKVNLTALAVFITSAVGGSMLLSAALAAGAGALFLLVGKTNLDEAQTLASIGAGLFILGLLCIPGLVLAFLELDHRPLPQLKKLHFNTIWLIPILVVALIATLLLGFFSTGSVMGVLLMPLAMSFTALVPLIFWLLVGTRKMEIPSPMRLWGSLSVSLTAVMPIAFMAEIMVLAAGLVLVVVWFSLRPDALASLQALADQLGTLEATADMEKIIGDLLAQKGVLPVVVLFTSLLVPLIEELVKPLAVWLLARRKLSQQQGFVLGMLGGACFGLVENINALSMAQTGADWWSTVLGRGGAGLLHVTTSGLLGWAIAAAFQHRKALPLIGAYALAVTLHGLWNLFGITYGLDSMLLTQPWRGLAAISLPVLFLLAALHITILGWINHRLARQPAAALE